MKLEGKWKKVTTEPCAEKYPDEIEFYDRPRFLAKKGPAQRFIWWDVGNYEAVGEGQVKIGTATGEIVTYEARLDGNLLTFVDDAKCEFTYKRES